MKTEEIFEVIEDLEGQIIHTHGSRTYNSITAEITDWHVNQFGETAEWLKEASPKFYNYLKDVLCMELYLDMPKEKALRLLDELELEKKRLESYDYLSIEILDKVYMAKSLVYSDQGPNPVLKYGVFSFYSKQELDACLSGLQRGVRGMWVSGLDENMSSVSNGYNCLYEHCRDENTADGVHAIIWQDTDDILKIYGKESPVDKVYDWLVRNTQTGLLDIPNGREQYKELLLSLQMDADEYEREIDAWKEYFYNALENNGYIEVCKRLGQDITPEIISLSTDITTEYIRALKQKGLREGEIWLPVKEAVSLDPETTFLDLVQDYVLDHVQSENAYYNLGDPISPIISSDIIGDDGEITNLYPRQQIMGQGLLDASKELNSIFLNGGTGVGKTFMSCKVALAMLQENSKKNTGRIAVYCQGHLIPKWERQFKQCLEPLGIYPRFELIESYKDVEKLDLEKPNELVIYLMPKDRVKRSYQIKHADVDRFTTKYNEDIKTFIWEIPEKEKYSKVEVFLANGLPATALKLAARKLSHKLKTNVVLVHKEVDKNGDTKKYKCVTRSSALFQAFRGKHTAYQFEMETMDALRKAVELNRDALDLEYQELQLKLYRKSMITHSSKVCPECNSFLYRHSQNAFDPERYLEFASTVPKTKSSINSKCRGYKKADGRQLNQKEMMLIREGDIHFFETEEDLDNPYFIDKEPVDDETLEEIRKGRYEGLYSIAIKECNSSIWTAFLRKGYDAQNAAKLMVKRFGRKSFDILIADEIHLYSRESEQGITYGHLCNLSKKVLGLTGTMTGGKASDLYYMLWRMMPQKMVDMGYKYDDVGMFIDHYGRRKRVTKEYYDNYNKSGIGKTTSSGWTEIPGMSPLLYTNFLSGTMVSRKLEDMGIPMVNLRYFKHEVEMDSDLSLGYENLKDDFLRFMRENSDLPVSGSYLHALLSYPDNPVQEPIHESRTGLLVAKPMVIDINNRLLAKEEKLISIIKEEIKEGRKVLVYTSYTGTKGVSKRLMKIIADAGITASELTSSVPLNRRETWIDNQARLGVDVIVTNPTIVETGLDLVQYPTIYFYSVTYNVKTMRQAEKRAWRPNQKVECRIYYSYYLESLQEDAVKLVGLKKKSSLALEGVFSEDLLSAMAEGGDSGAKILYDVLKGKVKLDESDLDSFGFDTEPIRREPIIIKPDNLIDMPILKSQKPKQEQISFSVTKKANKKVVSGQLSFF